MKETTAKIQVTIFDEDLTIDEICEPLENLGWLIIWAAIIEEVQE